MFGYATNSDSSAPQRKTEKPASENPRPASLHDIFGILLGIISIVTMLIRIMRAF